LSDLINKVTGGANADRSDTSKHGHLAQPANLVQAAKEAERLGYDTLWVGDRLLYPVNPRTKYPVTPHGSHRTSIGIRSGANISIRSAPLGADRAIFTGSLDQFKSDIDAVKNSAPTRSSS
jgi:alkanesulfonate monooxygenase SsuD/methylene tetrahydromethanopterin reductase-like flavin-dependent oxidoreductase (luciferase family)